MGTLESFLGRVWADGLKEETAEWPQGGGRSQRHCEPYLLFSGCDAEERGGTLRWGCGDDELGWWRALECTGQRG